MQNAGMHLGQKEIAPFLELPEDWEQFTPFMEAALDLMPVLSETGIQRFMNGPESFTADTRPLVGEAPDTDALFVAAGMNSVGIMSSAGVGRVLADWVVDGCAPMDLWEVDIARTDPATASDKSYASAHERSGLRSVHHALAIQTTKGRTRFAQINPYTKNGQDKGLYLALLQVGNEGCDYDWENFPFGTARKIRFLGKTLTATRLSFVGELGWELSMPANNADDVFDALVNTGAKPMGHYSLDACRIEKGFYHWGH
ncbi:Sarcosine dehydrogenase, mitochondrial [Nymphon striatum]|nr:Sarcosine dehydrogenase, mitochondrial [Nymphon striatum]